MSSRRWPPELSGTALCVMLACTRHALNRATRIDQTGLEIEPSPPGLTTVRVGDAFWPNHVLLSATSPFDPDRRLHHLPDTNRSMARHSAKLGPVGSDANGDEGRRSGVDLVTRQRFLGTTLAAAVLAKEQRGLPLRQPLCPESAVDLPPGPATAPCHKEEP